MKKRLLSMLLALSMVLSLMPISAMAEETHTSIGKSRVIEGNTVSAKLPEIKVTKEAAEMIRVLSSTTPPTSYNIKVSGVEVTSDNMDDVLGDGGTVRYTPASRTITLNNARITETYNGNISNYGIYTDSGLNIVLEGSNTVTIEHETRNWHGAIYVGGPLTISGSGSLNATGGQLSVRSKSSCGIYSRDLTISGPCSVIATGGKALPDECSSFGVNVDDGDLIVENGASLTASGDESSKFSSIGVMVMRGDIRVNGGSLEATGGLASAGNSYGISVSDIKKSLFVESGTVTATGGTAGTNSYGISANSIQINGGVVTASAQEQAMKNAPTFSSSIIYKNTAGVNPSSTDVALVTEEMLISNISSYKYVKIEPTFAISGRITNSSGDGIAATLQLKNGTNNVGSAVMAEESGEYSITGVSAGTYTIEVSHADYVTDIIDSFTVSNANITSKDLTLKVFVPISNITMTNANSVHANTNLILEGTVIPNNATNKDIIWSVESENGTGATVVGGVFTATSAGTATVKATVINGLTKSSDYITEPFVITVTNAPLTGNVTISGTLKYGQTLTGIFGSDNNTGTLSYQWKRGSIDGISIGTNSDTYTIVKDDIGQTLTCTVTSDVQTGSVSGSTTGTIDKADGPAVTGVSAVGCTTSDNNDGKLIGVTTAMEYKKISDASYTSVSGSAISVTGSAITGLINGDYLVRVAETDTHNAGPDSTFTVAAIIPAPTYSISGTITGNDTDGAIAGASVQLKSGSGNIGSSVSTNSSGTYTISSVPAGTYTIEVSAAGYDRGIISSVDVLDADITNQNLTLTKTVIFIPVADITMSNSASVQTATNLTLTGTITPGGATNRTITWSVVNANGTGATITGNTFRATSAGTATVKATVTNGLTANSDYTKTFTITVTAVPTPSPNPSPIPSPIEKPEGTVEVAQQQNDSAPAVIVDNSSNELKTSVLTPKEQEMVERGENAKIILKVTDIGTSISDEEKRLIQEKLASENGAVENGASDISVLYIDLSLYKQVGSQEQTKVTETNSKISISIEVPEELWNKDVTKNRAFYVVRIHDGEVTRIDGSYDADKNLFTFETDRFSTYALTYQDTRQIQYYHDFHHLQLKAKAGKTSQTLSYKRIANADGYLIYGGKCGAEMTKLAEVPANTTSYTVKNLKQGAYNKYQVKAYRMIGGEQVIIMTSKVVHSITESKTYANPTNVTTDSASVKLATGKSKTVTCQVVLPKGKKLKEHTAAIRYETSNKAIATVNSKGKITAKAKGICYVYAYAQNGAYKKIKVTVK
jgi:hypothetical protein